MSEEEFVALIFEIKRKRAYNQIVKELIEKRNEAKKYNKIIITASQRVTIKMLKNRYTPNNKNK